MNEGVLALLVASLRMGGTERVASTLANAWAVRGRRVIVLTLTGEDVAHFFELDERVRVRSLDLEAASASPAQALVSNLRRIRVLRHALSEARACAVIAFGSELGVMAGMACTGSGVPVIAAERSDPRRYPTSRVWRALRRLTYPHLYAIVTQTRSAADWFHLPRGAVIPNPLQPLLHMPVGGGDRRNVVVGLGRLVGDKGFDLLISAFARSRNAVACGWRLEIAGDGPERAALEARAFAEGVAGRVRFLGAVGDAARLLADSAVFALSSRQEGFPNALCEAMAAGCAVAAFDCADGPGEIVEHGVDGLLVPAADVAAMARALDVLVEDRALRERLAAKARLVGERYSVERVLARWEALLPPCAWAAA